MVVLGGLVTHPFLAALSRDLDATRVRAVRRGQAYVTGTGWHTANLAVHADALVLAAGLEAFSTAIDYPSRSEKQAVWICGARVMAKVAAMRRREIGRASCRERVSSPV